MERMATADITRPNPQGGEDVLEDAVLLADGSVMGRHANDVPRVVTTLQQILKDPTSTFVP